MELDDVFASLPGPSLSVVAMEPDGSAGAGRGEAVRSNAGLVVLVRCGDVPGHTQLELLVHDHRNGVVCAEGDLVCLRRM